MILMEGDTNQKPCSLAANCFFMPIGFCEQVRKPMGIKNPDVRRGIFGLSGRQDSNLRPPGPKPGALPACATSRIRFIDVVSADHDVNHY